MLSEKKADKSSRKNRKKSGKAQTEVNSNGLEDDICAERTSLIIAPNGEKKVMVDKSVSDDYQRDRPCYQAVSPLNPVAHNQPTYASQLKNTSKSKSSAQTAQNHSQSKSCSSFESVASNNQHKPSADRPKTHQASSSNDIHKNHNSRRTFASIAAAATNRDSSRNRRKTKQNRSALSLHSEAQNQSDARILHNSESAQFNRQTRSSASPNTRSRNLSSSHVAAPQNTKSLNSTPVNESSNTIEPILYLNSGQTYIFDRHNRTELMLPFLRDRRLRLQYLLEQNEDVLNSHGNLFEKLSPISNGLCVTNAKGGKIVTNKAASEKHSSRRKEKLVPNAVPVSSIPIAKSGSGIPETFIPRAQIPALANEALGGKEPTANVPQSMLYPTMYASRQLFPQLTHMKPPFGIPYALDENKIPIIPHLPNNLKPPYVHSEFPTMKEAEAIASNSNYPSPVDPSTTPSSMPPIVSSAEDSITPQHTDASNFQTLSLNLQANAVHPPLALPYTPSQHLLNVLHTNHVNSMRMPHSSFAPGPGVDQSYDPSPADSPQYKDFQSKRQELLSEFNDMNMVQRMDFYQNLCGFLFGSERSLLHSFLDEAKVEDETYYSSLGKSSLLAGNKRSEFELLLNNFLKCRDTKLLFLDDYPRRELVNQMVVLESGDIAPTLLELFHRSEIENHVFELEDIKVLEEICVITQIAATHSVMSMLDRMRFKKIHRKLLANYYKLCRQESLNNRNDCDSHDKTISNRSGSLCRKSKCSSECNLKCKSGGTRRRFLNVEMNDEGALSDSSSITSLPSEFSRHFGSGRRRRSLRAMTAKRIEDEGKLKAVGD